MADHWMHTLGSAVGSVILATGGMVLPAGTASAAPIPQAVTTTSLAQPPPGDQDRRLANGQFIRSGSRTGAGELAIGNGGDHDGVITLTLNKRAIYSVYVRQGSNYTVTGIRDGTYEVYFSTGVDWDSQSGGFTRDRSLQRFDETFDFTTTSTETTKWEITIYPVPGGNASTSAVDPSNFPDV